MSLWFCLTVIVLVLVVRGRRSGTWDFLCGATEEPTRMIENKRTKAGRGEKYILKFENTLLHK